MRTRTLFGALLVAAFTATGAHAQILGAKVGASFANWDVNTEGTEQSSITSFMGGGFLRFGLGRVGLQPEFLVVTRGSEVDDLSSDDDGTTKVDYLEIPVLLVLEFGAGSLSPYVFAGPSVAFEIGCKVDFSDVDGEATDCDDADTFERSKRDIGATAGGGLSFGFGPGNLFVEGRYNWGLTNIGDDPDLDEIEIKSRTGAVLVGFSTALGGR